MFTGDGLILIVPKRLIDIAQPVPGKTSLDLALLEAAYNQQFNGVSTTEEADQCRPILSSLKTFLDNQLNACTVQTSIGDSPKYLFSLDPLADKIVAAELLGQKPREAYSATLRSYQEPSVLSQNTGGGTLSTVDPQMVMDSIEATLKNLSIFRDNYRKAFQ